MHTCNTTSGGGTRLGAEADGARTRVLKVTSGDAALLLRNLQGDGSAENGTGGVAHADGTKTLAIGIDMQFRDAKPCGMAIAQLVTGAMR